MAMNVVQGDLMNRTPWENCNRKHQKAFWIYLDFVYCFVHFNHWSASESSRLIPKIWLTSHRVSHGQTVTVLAWAGVALVEHFDQTSHFCWCQHSKQLEEKIWTGYWAILHWFSEILRAPRASHIAIFPQLAHASDVEFPLPTPALAVRGTTLATGYRKWSSYWTACHDPTLTIHHT